MKTKQQLNVMTDAKAVVAFRKEVDRVNLPQGLVFETILENWFTSFPSEKRENFYHSQLMQNLKSRKV